MGIKHFWENTQNILTGLPLEIRVDDVGRKKVLVLFNKNDDDGMKMILI